MVMALIECFQQLQESVEVLVNKSNSVLYYSEDQSFPGPITAPALRVDAAHFGTLRIDKVREREGLQSGA